VRNVINLLGLALMGVSLYLLWLGASLCQANLRSGTFSARVWETTFWLRDPAVLERGFTDNALALLELIGGAVLAVLGWRLLRFVAHLGEER
jgi:hypothetical protein